MNVFIALVLIFGYFFLMVGIAAMIVFLVQARRLVRQLRKLAAQIPPYPVFRDSESNIDQTKVEFQEQWNDENLGRD